MENYRLKIKLGDCEFDAEGPHDVVQAQFQAFQDMVASLPQRQAAPPAEPLQPPAPVAENGDLSKTERHQIDAAITKIMRVDNRVVSLTVKPNSAEDAVLLLLLGQRLLRNNESPTGSEIVDGAERTGGLDMGRSDRLFERIARNGDVIMIGERRGKRYRLTNTGISKARRIAATLIELVA
jgi:hypothetical protein